MGVGDFITSNRTSGLECDQSSEKFSLWSMSAEAFGGVRAAAVLCGEAINAGYVTSNLYSHPCALKAARSTPGGAYQPPAA